MPETLPDFKKILQAKIEVKKFLSPTPLIRSHVLSDWFSAEIFLKNETINPTKSFKPRGALNHIIEALKKNPNLKGVVTSSTGNHGQGVTFAGNQFNLPAFIFLPKNPNQLKKEKIELLGGKTILSQNDDIDYAKEEAKQFAIDNDYEFIDDGESKTLIEGAGTIGLEIAEELKSIDYVFVPMGSGSLASGVACGLKGLQPNVKVIAVQPEGSPAMVESFNKKTAVERPINTIADGTVTRVPANLALNAVIKFIDKAILVSDEEILRGIKTLQNTDGILVEPSGAVALTGLFKSKEEIKNKTVVVILSGGNILPLYETMLENSLSYT